MTAMSPCIFRKIFLSLIKQTIAGTPSESGAFQITGILENCLEEKEQYKVKEQIIKTIVSL